MFKRCYFLALQIVTALVLHGGDHLEFGVPGSCDQILDREGFALGYSSAWKQPKWVSYRLTAEEVITATVGRSNDFQPDPDVKGSQSQLDDYRGSGYDRGHNAPSADMKWSAKAMKECFYLSNMSPQDGSCNSGIWNEIENTVRGFACAEGSVFVVTGPVVGKDPKTIGNNRVAVPDGFYKVVYDETPPAKMIAFYVPNRRMPGKPKDYACTVDRIEEMTGLDFFSKLPVSVQVKLEAECAVSAWDWSKSQRVCAKSGQNAPTFASGGERKEYFAGSQMPVSSRPAAPVCGDWPDTGFWLSTNSNKRHNKSCPNYRKTRGYPCQKNEGAPCGKCGG